MCSQWCAGNQQLAEILSRSVMCSGTIYLLSLVPRLIIIRACSLQCECICVRLEIREIYLSFKTVLLLNRIPLSIYYRVFSNKYNFTNFHKQWHFSIVSFVCIVVVSCVTFRIVFIGMYCQCLSFYFLPLVYSFIRMVYKLYKPYVFFSSWLREIFVHISKKMLELTWIASMIFRFRIEISGFIILFSR